jgi:hypothetical protein
MTLFARRANLTEEQKVLIKSGGGPRLAPEHRESAIWHVQKHLIETKRALERANSNVAKRVLGDGVKQLEKMLKELTELKEMDGQ